MLKPVDIVMRLITMTTPLARLGLMLLTSPVVVADEHAPTGVEFWRRWHDNGYWHGHGFWWVFPLMMVFMLIFLFLILRRDRYHWRSQWRWWMREYQSRHRPYEGRSAPESALDILNKRYARGEIDKEEYAEKKAAIMSTETDQAQRESGD